MRNSTGGGTPLTKKSKNATNNNNNNDEEKNSAKKLKLVQARLPFKIIAPGSSPVAATPTAAPKDTDGNKNDVKSQSGQKDNTADARKRKLSYESDDSDDVKVVSGEEEDNVSKENVEVSAAGVSKKKKLATETISQVEVVSLLDDDDEHDTDKKQTSSSISKLKTPKAVRATSVGKQKGAGTPKTTSNAQKEKSGSASKLQIKLPVSTGKKSKRRKSKINSLLANTSSNDVSNLNNSCAESSDDIEEFSNELNPQKRTKLDDNADKEQEEAQQEKTEKTASEDTSKKNEDEDPISLDSKLEKDEEKVNKVQTKESREISVIENEKSETASTENTNENEENKNTTDNTEQDKIQENKENQLEESILLDSTDDDDEGSETASNRNDNDADDETENTSNKNANISPDISEDSKSKHNATIESVKDSENGSSKSKCLTPKQKKLLEQRHKSREEKERKLQEEKKKKQQEKEDKELAKKRERDEKEEQKRKEREEKEEVKRKEREEKERKRLSEVEAKNEEKRKRNEAKEEETRKKDEERKRKEQEKEEAELKKKKAAQAFTKFFVAKTPASCKANIDDNENTGDGAKSFAFRPFQIKGDMKMAPLCRKNFTGEAKHRLDSLLGLRHTNKCTKGEKMDVDESDEDDEVVVRAKPIKKSQLYVAELRAGRILPGKWRRPSTESKDDVIFIEDELERVGQAIGEDTPATIVREQMRVKFYKFHDNRRPPYYGTWRKRSSVINPKKPFAQDRKFFDYEVDSDDEWEEEEPGESLEDASDEDKEKESEDDDYEVDNEWFVPHGHLSDEEMQNEDDFGMGDDNTREAQKAKLQILQKEFAQEMKKKTEKIKPRLIGCIWIDANGNQPEGCAKIIWDTLNMRAMLCTDPPVLDEPEVEEPSSPSASNNGNSDKLANEKLKPIAVTELMVKDLVRLLHGNNNAKAFLIKEYIAYVEKTEESVKNGKFSNPLKASIREKIESIAEWQIVEAATVIDSTVNDSTKKKKKPKKRLCWVVNQETLNKLEMSSLSLQNSWEYILTPKLKETTTTAATKPEEGVQPIVEATNEISSKTEAATVDVKVKKSQIKQFTKSLTAEEKFNNLNISAGSSSPKTLPKDTKIATENKAKSPAASTTTQTPKEKKRVPLLMSVGRGQQISTPAKNKLISQFLQKGKSSDRSSTRTNRPPSPVADDDDVVILD